MSRTSKSPIIYCLTNENLDGLISPLFSSANDFCSALVSTPGHEYSNKTCKNVLGVFYHYITGERPIYPKTFENILYSLQLTLKRIWEQKNLNNEYWLEYWGKIQLAIDVSFRISTDSNCGRNSEVLSAILSANLVIGFDICGLSKVTLISEWDLAFLRQLKIRLSNKRKNNVILFVEMQNQYFPFALLFLFFENEKTFREDLKLLSEQSQNFLYESAVAFSKSYPEIFSRVKVVRHKPVLPVEYFIFEINDNHKNKIKSFIKTGIGSPIWHQQSMTNEQFNSVIASSKEFPDVGQIL
jgi:hypothetical protein